MSDLKHSDIIKSAQQRGLISRETMAKALDGNPRAIAYTQWKLDGNDGPASPPEGWQAEVTSRPFGPCERNAEGACIGKCGEGSK